MKTKSPKPAEGVSPPKLKLVVVDITHRCPYKQQDVPLAACYVNSEDSYHLYCYGCDYVPHLKEEYGLRTYKKVPAPLDRPVNPNKLVYAPVRGTGGREWFTVNVTTGERKLLRKHARERVTQGGAAMWSDRASKPAGLPTSVVDASDLERREVAVQRAAQARSADRRAFIGALPKGRKGED